MQNKRYSRETNPGIPFVVSDLISLYGHTGKIFLKKFSVCGVFFLWNADNTAFTDVPEGIGTDFGDSGGKSDIFQFLTLVKSRRADGGDIFAKGQTGKLVSVPEGFARNSGNFVGDTPVFDSGRNVYRFNIGYSGSCAGNSILAVYFVA